MCLNINHPKYTNQIIAHNYILHELIHLYNNKKLHHAYIFNGIKGVGKASLAYYFTKLILSNKTHSILTQQLNNSLNINLILNNNHPNLLVIEPEYDPKLESYKENITIDQIRQIKPFLTSSSLTYHDLPKIIIIDAIDNLNINAANSILKILEEPLHDRIFLLICHNIHNILPTIKSRCIVKNFSPLNKSHLCEIVKSLKLVKDNEESLLSILNEQDITEGNIQEILWLTNKDHVEALNLAKNIIQTKDIKKLNILAENIKNFTSDNFKFLLESILNSEPFTKIYKTDIYTKSSKIKSILEQEKVFNIDKQTILTTFILDFILQYCLPLFFVNYIIY